MLEAAVALTGLQGLSAYQTGRRNQRQAEREAASVVESNRLNERMEADRVRRLMASQRAAAAASGITLDGSPAQVALDTMDQYYRDRAIREYNAQVQASGIRYQGQQAARQGAAGLLGGLGQAAMTFGLLRTPRTPGFASAKKGVG